MNVIVLPRLLAEKYKDKRRYIVISIHNPEKKPAVFKEDFNRLGILYLTFHDIGKVIEGKITFSAEMASCIKTFVNMHKNACHTILVHCEHGISRSAGVAIGVSHILGLDYSKFMNRPYLPNSLAMKEMLQLTV